MSDYASWRLSVDKSRLERLAGAALIEAKQYPPASAAAYFMAGATGAYNSLLDTEVPSSDNIAAILSKCLDEWETYSKRYSEVTND